MWNWYSIDKEVLIFVLIVCFILLPVFFFFLVLNFG